MRVVESKFVSAAGKLESLLEESLPEVAFAGRSNVGKSSLLNALSNRKGLFKVSKEPGRTRTIVHIEARLDTGESLYLVDLPGYGFARVAKGAVESWGRLIDAYLKNRKTLHLVGVLVDIRRGIQEEEEGLLEFLDDRDIPAVIVATKCDKVSKNEQFKLLQTMEQTFGYRAVPTSADTKAGIETLLQVMAQACGYHVPTN